MSTAPASVSSSLPRRLAQHLPGLLLAAALGGVAIWAARLPLLAGSGLSALPLAICLGLLVGNTVYARLAARCHSGIGIAKQQVLRTAIVLYGLRLTFQDIAQVGWALVVIDVLMLCSTFFLAQWLGRALGMEPRTTALIGAGASICGAAAVLATAPVVKARGEQVAVAVATVVVFGTVGTFLYPALFHWNATHGWLAVNHTQYGLYVGSTVHEVAQVVAAGEAIAPAAADVAVLAKMARVMMLAPFLLLLSLYMSRRAQAAAGAAGSAAASASIPWFAVGFIVMAAVHSLGVLPAALVQWGIYLDNALLALAMAALGLSTHLSAVRAAGARPLLLAALLFLWLLCGGLALNGGVLGVF